MYMHTYIHTCTSNMRGEVGTSRTAFGCQRNQDSQAIHSLRTCTHAGDLRFAALLWGAAAVAATRRRPGVLSRRPPPPPRPRGARPCKWGTGSPSSRRAGGTARGRSQAVPPSAPPALARRSSAGSQRGSCRGSRSRKGSRCGPPWCSPGGRTPPSSAPRAGNSDPRLDGKMG